MAENLIEPVPISYAENTAFTSILVGVFLNSPLIDSQHLEALRNLNIGQKYGNSFQHSLNLYSQKRPMEQVGILHKIQR